MVGHGSQRSENYRGSEKTLSFPSYGGAPGPSHCLLELLLFGDFTIFQYCHNKDQVSST